MNDPQAALRAVCDRLEAVAGDARDVRNDGQRRGRLAAGVLAAIKDGQGGNEAAGRALIADLVEVRDEAAALLDEGGPKVGRVARAALQALSDARAIRWHVEPPPNPTLTVRGFQAVTPSASAPVEAVATLALSAPATDRVTATATLTGLAAADLADGRLSFTAVVPAGQTSAPLPVRFAAQTLAADKTGSLALSAPSGATLGDPSGFSFVLKANHRVSTTVSFAQGFDRVVLRQVDRVDETVVVARGGDTGGSLTVGVEVTGLPEGVTANAAPAKFPGGAKSAEATVVFQATRALGPGQHTARCALVPPQGVALGERPSFDFALVQAGTGSGDSWIGKRGYDNPSGHGWFNGLTPYGGKGVAAQIDAITRFRNGVPPDCMTIFQGGSNTSSWDQYVKAYQPGSEFQIGADAPLVGRAGKRCILTIPLLNRPVAGQWEQAAGGQFATYWRQVAEAIKGYGLPTPIIVRFDRESDDVGQPFGAERDAANGFKNFVKAHNLACSIFADVLGRSNLIFTFCLTKRGARGLKTWEWAPEFLDAYDCDFYVNQPVFGSPSDWTIYKRFLEPFVERCSETGKPICFSEWGIKVAGNGSPQNDNGYFMEAFFPWLQANKVSVLHENYYNPDQHGIFPVDGRVDAPEASAAYRRVWGNR